MKASFPNVFHITMFSNEGIHDVASRCVNSFLAVSRQLLAQANLVCFTVCICTGQYKGCYIFFLILVTFAIQGLFYEREIRVFVLAGFDILVLHVISACSGIF